MKLFVLSLTVSFTLRIALCQTTQTKKENLFFCGYGENNNSVELCNFLQSKTTTVNQSAKDAVDKILKPLGLPCNFVLVSCPNIQNAVAVTLSDGIRYIVYDNSFMESIASSTSAWSNISILAHEIGHHLCGHTLSGAKDLPDQRKKELEADKFSGFIMYKMGATLQQAEAAIYAVASTGDDSFSTHPNRSKRLTAIEKGYNEAKGQQTILNIDKKPSAENYFNIGYGAIDEQNFDDAIYNFKQAIAINPEYPDANYYLGWIYDKKADYETACNYLDKACSLNQEFITNYHLYASVHASQGDYNTAIYYFKRVITSYPSKDNSDYVALAGIYYQKKDFNSAIYYYEKAVSINSNDANAYSWLGSSYSEIKNYDKAIEYCKKAITINPNSYNNYLSLALVYSAKGDSESFRYYYNKAKELGAH